MFSDDATYYNAVKSMEEGEFTIQQSVVYDFVTKTEKKQRQVMYGQQVLFDCVSIQPGFESRPASLQNVQPLNCLPQPLSGIPHGRVEVDGSRCFFLDMAKPESIYDVPPKVKKPIPGIPSINKIEKPAVKTDWVGRKCLQWAICAVIAAVASIIVPIPFIIGVPVGVAYGCWQLYQAKKRESGSLKEFAITASTVTGAYLLPSAFYLAALAGALAGAQCAHLLFRSVTHFVRSKS